MDRNDDGGELDRREGGQPRETLGFPTAKNALPPNQPEAHGA
jgi:hypothetical protein